MLLIAVLLYLIVEIKAHSKIKSSLSIMKKKSTLCSHGKSEHSRESIRTRITQTCTLALAHLKPIWQSLSINPCHDALCKQFRCLKVPGMPHLAVLHQELARPISTILSRKPFEQEACVWNLRVEVSGFMYQIPQIPVSKSGRLRRTLSSLGTKKLPFVAATMHTLPSKP